jgi:hypothetical protein
LLVRVLGSGFISTSEVRVNGALRGTSWVSATELEVYLSGPVDLAEAGTLAITVVTPPPGGGTSSAVDFIVTNEVSENRRRGALPAAVQFSRLRYDGPIVAPLPWRYPGRSGLDRYLNRVDPRQQMFAVRPPRLKGAVHRHAR